ncbi:hypothetical protein QAD02_011576 [Eretmocerus hayati]|uniref:Uncharacterized protein n=1 Tax=Eretmocerus hayati TaxID=131215 RepID=A0ACC2NWT5_9HYME|nr:hypothetical protein QAD02_011576 [Eretmocerus hayati]
MAPCESTKTYSMILRELEPMLRTKLGKDFELVNYNSDSLLPVGENYGSTILKVRAIIKRKGNRNENEETSELDLVAKMLPATDFQRVMFDIGTTFRKETFLYEKLMPAYRQLEEEFGIAENELFDIVPEFYGSRSSIAQPDGELDEDACILMKNLKSEGYYMADRRTGLDLAHAKVAAAALSRFHALGIALKIHKLDYFEIVRKRAKCFTVGSLPEGFTIFVDNFHATIRKDPKTSVYYDQCIAAMSLDMKELWSEIPVEPWATIIHADFWINNFMFKKDPTTGQVVDIKFVDFQNYLFLSPLRELTFFLMMNFNSEVMENHFDEVLDYYYDNFINVLRRMKCNVQPFNRRDFDEAIKKDAFKEFGHCVFISTVMTKNVLEDTDVAEIQDLLCQDDLDPLCVQKLRRIILKYGEKDWFCQSNTSKSNNST